MRISDWSSDVCSSDLLDMAAEAAAAVDGNRKLENAAMTNLLMPPEKCQSMAEIRAAIDALDHDIVTLLSERMRYIDAAARVKPERDTVRDEQRKAAVIGHAGAGSEARRDGKRLVSPLRI